MKSHRRTLTLFLALCLALSLVPLSGFAAEGTVTLNFDANYEGAEAVDSLTVKTGEKVENDKIPEPAREGYTFAGWYKVKEGELQHQALQAAGGAIEIPAEETTYYAQWIENDHIKYVETGEGSRKTTLGYSTFSGINIIDEKGKIYTEADIKDYDAKKDGPLFKDLNKNGALDAYEDWRKDEGTRSTDLAKQLTNEEIAGLMLYSAHQRGWTDTNEKVVTDQISFLANDDLRHVLIAGAGNTADVHAKWNNTSQAMSERFGKGIPNNNSSDPRHSAAIGVEFYSNNDGTMSIWPTSLGIAATFDPQEMLKFGKVASAEYRAFGISTALSPQIDISTDPRWNRTSGTFGEDPKLSADMTAAYVTGFQGTFRDSKDGEWGYDSVNAMIKHWPGGGAGESGRDAHNDFGKYSVFPGNDFQAHIVPFVDGALTGSTGSISVATAVMPYYTITNNVDPTGTDVANGFSKYMISDLLRENYKFEGVVCTDWGVDRGRGWGPSIEDMDTTQRSYELIMAGINQFGGQNLSKYILEAREIAVAKGTATQYDQAMQDSAYKLLLNVFRVGLFENPYLDPETSVKIATDATNNQAGIDTQVKALVMMKNTDSKGNLVTATTKVYVPKTEEGNYLFTNKGLDGNDKFIYEDDINQADMAIVSMNTPTNPGAPGETHFGGGWNPEEGDLLPKGYFPLTLQYSEYTAVHARAMSIAGDYRDKDVATSASVLNRSYKNRTTTSTNYASLLTLLETKESMGSKPVITILNIDNPTVMTEIDAASDVIVGRFACSDAAVLEILTGAKNSTGMLPLQFPKNMEEVEKQYEDVPRDMEVYVDAEGHSYDFGYGLTLVDGEYKVIGVETNDTRYNRYVKPSAMTKPSSTVNNHISDYPTLKTNTLPVGAVGQPYSAQIEAKESNATFKLVRVEQNVSGTAGSLPKGLRFDNGVISGTPTAAAEVQLVVKASVFGKEDRIFRLNLLISEEEVVVNADPNALSIAITLASVAKEENYKTDTWGAFEDALAKAKDVYATATETGGFKATQSEIDRATKDLESAQKALVRAN